MAAEAAGKVGEERYKFQCEWYDQQAQINRYYMVTYYPVDTTIDMVSSLKSLILSSQFDIKNKRIFLKRCEYPSVVLGDFFIGAVVTIYARMLKVVDYGDVYTRSKFETERQRTFALIKPESYTSIGKAIDFIQSQGFQLNKLKMGKLTGETASKYLSSHPPTETDSFTKDVSVGIEVISKDAISQWANVLTQATPAAFHGSSNPKEAKNDIDFWFGKKKTIHTTAIMNNCSLCIIKPHIIKEGNAGKIIDAILAQGFEISAMEMFYLDRPSVEEFWDVYKGVLAEYIPMIEHLSAGPIIAMEIRQDNCVSAFREFVGPTDPEIAKHLRPNTIRALFGHDRVRNAVHCTDMPEDGVIECEYFFKILQAYQP